MATDFSQDAVNNAIYKGIRRGIEVTIDNGCLGSAAILILSAIDAMAYLAMPEQREDVTKEDFILWAGKYIRFPCREQLTGEDLYGARCAMLHAYGAQSKMSREGKCRVILWTSRAVPPIMAHPATPGYVMVSVPDLRDSLFAGVDRFLIEVFRERSSKRAELVNRRLNSLVQEMSTDQVLRATAEGA
jgi:hypothetical protein